MQTQRPDYEAWKEWLAEDFGKFSSDQDAYYRAEVFARCPATPSTRMLEIGFGNGSLLGFSKSLGLQVAGVELNPVLRQRAAGVGIEVFDATTALPDNTFDVAVALDVMEHVPDGKSIEFLSDIKRSLRPGGLLILRFPNGDSPFGRAMQYGDVTHVSVVGSVKIEYFAKGAGLRVVEIANQRAPTAHLPAVLRLKRELRKAGQRTLEALLGKTFYDGRRPLGQNLVTVLHKPET